jgi:4-hydroxy-2-oxoglutarate aldolase
MKLEGIFAPLTVPFTKHGEVDTPNLRRNIEHYNATPLAGYVMNGTTGESVLLRWEEIYRNWDVAKEAADASKVLIAGTGAESTAETIAHTERAAGLGFDFALVRTPSYYKSLMTDEAEAEHFLRVADAAKIPVLVYSIPQCTGVTVEAPLIERLSKHENIVGIKDSSGNVERVEQMHAAAGDFQILVGSAAMLEKSLRAGAVGGILAVACAFPEWCCEVYEAYRAGDEARAARVQEKLMGPSALLVSMYGIPGLKYALDALGYFGGAPRAPLLPLKAEAKKEIDGMLEGLGVARVA